MEFLIGIIIGTTLGVICMALMNIFSESDEQAKKLSHP